MKKQLIILNMILSMLVTCISNIYANNLGDYPQLITSSKKQIFLTNLEKKQVKILYEAGTGYDILDIDFKKDVIAFLLFKKEIINPSEKIKYEREKYYFDVYLMPVNSKNLPKKIFHIESYFGEMYEGIRSISLSPSGKYLLLEKSYLDGGGIEFINLNTKKMLLKDLNIRGHEFFQWVNNSDRVFFFNHSTYGDEGGAIGNTILYELDLNSPREIAKREYKLCYPISFDFEKRYLVCRVPGEKMEIFKFYDHFGAWKKVFNADCGVKRKGHSVKWIEPWWSTENQTEDFRKKYELELQKELPPVHELYGLKMKLIGIGDGVDCLFEILDGSGRVTDVQLTWSGKQEGDAWPSFSIHESLEDWVETVDSEI